MYVVIVMITLVHNLSITPYYLTSCHVSSSILVVVVASYQLLLTRLARLEFIVSYLGGPA